MPELLRPDMKMLVGILIGVFLVPRVMTMIPRGHAPAKASAAA